MNGATDGIMLAMLGPRELVVVAFIALILYGRSGMLRSRPARWLRPWRDTGRRGAAAGRERGDRTFWFLAIVAATAVAAWIVTRTLILGAPGASH